METKVKFKKISLFSGIMLALNSLIGSGWLFGAGTAAKIAGPAAIISWVIGAIIIIAIALNYVELGAMFPESGGMSRFAQYSHGPLLGFIAAWANWISLITLVPMEAVAAVQYMSSWPWSWANWTHKFLVHGNLSWSGLAVVILFMLIFTLINFWSVQLMTRFTNLISVFKIAMPTLTIVLLLATGFHASNFAGQYGFMPYGVRSIFEATAVSGIIMSYDAFQTIINMGGEMENPQRNIVRGVIISMLITAAIYIMLQVTFVAAVSPKMLAQAGWHGISFTSPFADLALLLNLNWLVILLYLDAFVSPFGTGVAFVATASRTLAALTRSGHLPAWLGRLARRYLIPRFAMIFDLLFAIVLVSIFRNWNLLATVITAATLIAYLTGPVTVISLRKIAPHLKRTFAPKWMPYLAPFAFAVTSLAIYWTTTIEVILIIVLGLPIYFHYECRYQHRKLGPQLKASAWFLAYLVFISLFSYCGSQAFGGKNYLPFPLDFVILILCSLAFYYWGLASRLKQVDPEGEKVNQRVDKLN